MSTALPTTAPAALVRPVLRRAWLWIALLVALLLAAVVLATAGSAPARPFDPASAAATGSKALARLLTGYGATVRSTDQVAEAMRGSASASVVVTSVVVIAPDDYSPAQLRRLRAAARRLVLVQPGTAALHAVFPQASVTDGAQSSPTPDCTDPGAVAAGPLDGNDGGVIYRGVPSCYGGLLVLSPRLAVLGSAALLRNDRLARQGVAAVDVNTITADRSITSVTWLLPGADAGGPAPATVWDLFPGGTHRAFWWLLATGALLVLWRGRRLGTVVAEPLPVVVRSIETVEGHGRLWARAGARDRAAAALRQAAIVRLAARLGLPHRASTDDVAAAAAAVLHRPPAELVSLLRGPAPADDAQLIELTRALDSAQAAVAAATPGGRA